MFIYCPNTHIHINFFNFRYTLLENCYPPIAFFWTKFRGLDEIGIPAIQKSWQFTPMTHLSKLQDHRNLQNNIWLTTQKRPLDSFRHFGILLMAQKLFLLTHTHTYAGHIMIA